MRALLGSTGLVLVAGAAVVGSAFGVSSCGPQTYGPACTAAGVAWIPLLVIGLILAIVSAFPRPLWSIPALWTVTVIVTWIAGHVNDVIFAVTAVVLGGVASGALILIQVMSRRRGGDRATAE